MKYYNQPETKVHQVMNNGIICASGEPAHAPALNGQLGTMENTDGSW